MFEFKKESIEGGLIMRSPETLKVAWGIDEGEMYIERALARLFLKKIRQRISTTNTSDLTITISEGELRAYLLDKGIKINEKPKFKIVPKMFN